VAVHTRRFDCLALPLPESLVRPFVLSERAIPVLYARSCARQGRHANRAHTTAPTADFFARRQYQPTVMGCLQLRFTVFFSRSNPGFLVRRVMGAVSSDAILMKAAGIGIGVTVLCSFFFG